MNTLFIFILLVQLITIVLTISSVVYIENRTVINKDNISVINLIVFIINLLILVSILVTLIQLYVPFRY